MVDIAAHFPLALAAPPESIVATVGAAVMVSCSNAMFDVAVRFLLALAAPPESVMGMVGAAVVISGL
jgi:hypothetical protein